MRSNPRLAFAASIAARRVHSPDAVSQVPEPAVASGASPVLSTSKVAAAANAGTAANAISAQASAATMAAARVPFRGESVQAGTARKVYAAGELP